MPDSADEKTLVAELAETDKETIFLKITAVKPLVDPEAQSNPSKSLEFGVSKFFFSTPFTQKVCGPH